VHDIIVIVGIFVVIGSTAWVKSLPRKMVKRKIDVKNNPKRP
jgi:hypothetical protein